MLRALASLVVVAGFSSVFAVACDRGGAVEAAATAAASAEASAAPEAKPLPPSTLRRDEVVEFFPALAIPAAGGGHEVRLRTWVYEPEEGSPVRSAALGALRRALELPEASEESAIFRERARAFLVDNERGKRITVTIGGRDFALDPTAANGQSETVLRFAAGELADPTTPVIARLVAGDPRRFVGVIHRVDPGGLSVISDIDDTIKISEVRDRERLLARTFTMPFEAAPGVAAAYRRWAEGGALFHFVSASPWQLYGPLAAFVAEAGFPAGTFHLKSFRWKDSSFFALFEDPVAYKLAILRPLITALGGRRFILVGDSGEKDPEIYSALLREFGDAVVHVYIRDVSDEGSDAPRYRELFAEVPADRWTIFRDGAGLDGGP